MSGVRVIWFQDGLPMQSAVFIEGAEVAWLDSARDLWAGGHGPVRVISAWPVGPLRVGELPEKWDWPGSE